MLKQTAGCVRPNAHPRAFDVSPKVLRELLETVVTNRWLQERDSGILLHLGPKKKHQSMIARSGVRTRDLTTDSAVTATKMPPAARDEFRRLCFFSSAETVTNIRLPLFPGEDCRFCRMEARRGEVSLKIDISASGNSSESLGDRNLNFRLTSLSGSGTLADGYLPRYPPAVPIRPAAACK